MWRKQFGGMEVPEVNRLKALEEEEENARLNKLLAEVVLDTEGLQVALGESTDHRTEAGCSAFSARVATSFSTCSRRTSNSW